MSQPTTHITCAKCDYILADATTDELCPECGLSAKLSIQDHRDADKSAVIKAKVIRALGLICLAKEALFLIWFAKEEGLRSSLIGFLGTLEIAVHILLFFALPRMNPFKSGVARYLPRAVWCVMAAAVLVQIMRITRAPAPVYLLWLLYDVSRFAVWLIVIASLNRLAQGADRWGRLPLLKISFAFTAALGTMSLLILLIKMADAFMVNVAINIEDGGVEAVAYTLLAVSAAGSLCMAAGAQMCLLREAQSRR
jgi:hypothetical protein